ncbi:MAG: riboflavin synthase [Deltaproteobacteria bacterium]|nr:riboflavin synthase [Deltaproteobacteria bacterium]MBW2601814.1 riboflavin synthase [Deltaproteobacteria bacterium]
MFTGIIEGLGTIKDIARQGGGVRMEVHSDYPIENVHIGDSLAINGACLTVVHIKGKAFKVDIAPETLSRSTMGQAKVGNKVNLERAVRLGDRLDGHMVTGHVDGIGKVRARRSAENAVLFGFAAPQGLCDYIVEKGSIAVDGISLTVNACDRKGFEVSIIPHTANVTTLGAKRVGDAVNIETDLIGKYVQRFTQQAQGLKPRDSIDEGVLAKAGFI